MERRKERMVLIFDVGTQSSRALLVNNRGEILSKSKVRHDPPYRSSKTDYAEQDPDFYYRTIAAAARTLKEQAPERWTDIEAVALTTIRDTAVCVDADGIPLRPAFLWLDHRKAGGVPRFSHLIALMLKTVGMEQTAIMQYRKGKCNWMREQEGDLWARTHKFLLLSGYLTFRLTGRMADCAASMVGHIPFDHRTRTWQKKSDLTWPVFPIEAEKLCEIVEPGENIGSLTPEAAADFGLPTGLPLIAAGSDKACEVLGLGCTTREKAALSFGTTATVTFTTEDYVEPERFIPPYASIIKGRFTPEIEIFRGYWLVSWFKKEFAAKEMEEAAALGVSAEELLNRRLQEIPAGCDGLIFQPYFTPNTTMPSARGAIIGFSDVHTRLHIYRAIIEGINFALMDGLRMLERQAGHHFSELYVGGGGAQSDEICQITANMFGLPVRRTQTFEVSGIGCAMAAFVGLGEFKGYDEAVRHMVFPGDCFLPDPNQHDIYETLYRDIFQNIYGKLSPLYQRLSEIYPPAPSEGIPSETSGALR